MPSHKPYKDTIGASETNCSMMCLTKVVVRVVGKCISVLARVADENDSCTYLNVRERFSRVRFIHTVVLVYKGVAKASETETEGREGVEMK